MASAGPFKAASKPPGQWGGAWLWFLSNRRNIGLALSGALTIFRGSLLLADQSVLVDTLSRVAELLLLGSVGLTTAGASKSDSFFRETLARADVGLPERRGGERQREAITELKAVSSAPVLQVVEAIAEISAIAEAKADDQTGRAKAWMGDRHG